VNQLGPALVDSAANPSFVPDGFDPPRGQTTADFLLEPLAPEHNAADHEAWTSSIPHIQATPGFSGRDWPTAHMTLEENWADLRQHADDFHARTGFTFTVLEPKSRLIVGCVYFYPPSRAGFDVDVRSWVRESHAELDTLLYEAVTKWLAAAWPWRCPDYACRPVRPTLPGPPAGNLRRDQGSLRAVTSTVS